MAIKKGDVAIVKITGEPVFVLNTYPTDNGYFSEMAFVRRFTHTDDFQGYVESTLFLEELETQKERLQKDYDSFSELVPNHTTTGAVLETSPEKVN